MNIETLIDVELEDRLNEMSALDPTSEDYKAREDVSIKLIDRKVKLAELDLQAAANKQNAEVEATKLKLQEEANTLKAMEIKEAKIRHIVDSAVNIGTTVFKLVGIAAVGIGLTKFEREDSLVSTPTKEIFKGLLRFKI